MMLTKVETQKQFMDELHKMNTHEDEELEVGKPRDLKSYMLETNKPLQKQYMVNNISINIEDTGLNHVKIITAEKESGQPVQYYLDMTDKRFLILHTNEQATVSDSIVKKIISSNTHQFDSAWLHTDMLKSIASSFGNQSRGYDVRYKDIFKVNDSANDPRTDLKIDITGPVSDKILKLIKDDKNIRPIIGYRKITISKGAKDDGVLETLGYNGRFRLVKGDSIDEHISLIEQVTDTYRKSVEMIESERIRGQKTGSGFTIEGNSFTFEFERDIEDWNQFLPKIFNGVEPFRIWGLRTKPEDGMWKILCVDMHTGDHLDIEVGGNMMRVYLSDHACGNAVMRLYTNLQRHLDANMRCVQLEQ